MTRGQAQLFGVIGHPVAHSRSPRMQRAAFAALGIDATYLAFDVLPEQLEVAVRGLFALGAGGANVTLPHKVAVMAYLEGVDDHARRIGAVNTLVRGERGFVGSNTDGAGLAAALREDGVDPAGARVVVLGAGGAARAAVVGLATAGATEIAVCARRDDAARDLVASLGPGLPTASLTQVAFDRLGSAFAHCDLFVQATSATMGSAPEAATFAASVPFAALPESAVVVDLVYEPTATTVLEAARLRGLRTVGGTGMLVHQGALAFERWFGRPAPIAAMAAAVVPP